MTSKKHRRPQLLSSTRPRNVKPTASLSSRTTRTLVRTHHTLRKQLSSALKEGNDVEAKELEAQIDATGGLATYQQASIQGQAAQRGGDTSRVLMGWLEETKLELVPDRNARKMRMLEVGSLRTDNACSKSGLFHMTRIDLHSQHPEITEQDFMTLSFPRSAALEHNGFDIVSLSLVVNFVSSTEERGDMLKRVSSFLRQSQCEHAATFPALFLVLPVACVTNSRYMDEAKLDGIMESLGYEKRCQKKSAKLVYYLWHWTGSSQLTPQSFKKQEVRGGKSRNNFAITMH